MDALPDPRELLERLRGERDDDLLRQHAERITSSLTPAEQCELLMYMLADAANDAHRRINSVWTTLGSG